MTLYGGIDLHSNNAMISIIDAQDHLVFEKRLPRFIRYPGGLRAGRPSPPGFHRATGRPDARTRGQSHVIPRRPRAEPPLLRTGHASQVWQRR